MVYLNLYGSYQLTDQWQLSASIRNALDRAPPVSPYPNLPQPQFNGQYYDVIWPGLPDSGDLPVLEESHAPGHTDLGRMVWGRAGMSAGVDIDELLDTARLRAIHLLHPCGMHRGDDD